MMNVHRGLVTLAFAIPLLGAGCGGQTGPGSLAPSVEPGVVRTELTPARTDLLLLETFPVQVRLSVAGELPNPCARLGWSVSPGDDQGRIEVAFYADQPTGTACIQVLAPYAETIPLGSFERGSYGVFVNGQPVEEFVLP
jgi:hypothetical protein